MNPLSYVDNDSNKTQYAGTALIIDSDAINQNILKRYLNEINFSVNTTNYLINPLTIPQYKYNLIFITNQSNSDIAFSIAENIKSLDPFQTILLCSNLTELVSKTQYQAKGICDIISKPLNQAEIISKINKHAPECCNNFDPSLPLEMINSDSSIAEGLDFLEHQMFNIFKEKISTDIHAIETEKDPTKLKKTFHRLKSSYAQFGFIKSQSFFAQLSVSNSFTNKDLNYLRKQTLADITAFSNWLELQKKINKKGTNP